MKFCIIFVTTAMQCIAIIIACRVLGLKSPSRELLFEVHARVRVCVCLIKQGPGTRFNFPGISVNATLHFESQGLCHLLCGNYRPSFELLTVARLTGNTTLIQKALEQFSKAPQNVLHFPSVLKKKRLD